MAIALDAVTNAGPFNGNNSFNHTVTGSNTILFLLNMGVVGASTGLSAATYNGVALTKITESQVPTNRAIDVWYLVGPASGTNSLAVTFTGDELDCVAISYTGAAQTGQPDASTSSTGTSVTSLTETLTTTADNCWLVSIFGGNAFIPTAGTNATVRGSNANGSQAFDTNAAQTPAGSKSIQALVTSGNMAGIAVSFAPVASAVVVTPRRRIFKHH